jgi:hypothetical protein
VQAIERGKGPISIDYYRVKITKMPTIAGALASPEILLRHIRLNLNKMVNTMLAYFEPFDTIEETKWISANPLGAIIHIALAWEIGNPDDGSCLGPDGERELRGNRDGSTSAHRTNTT